MEFRRETVSKPVGCETETPPIKIGLAPSRFVVSVWAHETRKRIPRVSTDDQSAVLQLAAPKRAGCETIFSAAGEDTSTLRGDDTLMVWKLDRLARSLLDLIPMVDVRDRGVGFQSLHAMSRLN